MQPRSKRVGTLLALGAACILANASAVARGQTDGKEQAIVAHRYHAGRTAGVQRELDEQATSSLDARRDLSKTRFSEYRSVSGPRGLSLARVFLEETSARLHARGLDNCRMSDTSVDCPTHYLSPGYPRIYLRLRYTYSKTEVGLDLQAYHREANGELTGARGRLSLEDAEWYQRLFLRLVDLAIGAGEKEPQARPTVR